LLLGAGNQALLPFVIHRAAAGDFEALVALHDLVSSWSAGTMSLGFLLSVLCTEDIPHVTEEDLERETRTSYIGRAD
jgi:hypothetical protein